VSMYRSADAHGSLPPNQDYGGSTIAPQTPHSDRFLPEGFAPPEEKRPTVYY